MDWNNQLTKTPYLILFIVLITIGVGTASAFITIQLAGNVQVDGDLNVDGTISGSTIDDQHTKFHLLSEGSKVQPVLVNQFVHYKVTGAVAGVPAINSPSKSLFFPISAHSDGELTVSLPRELIDATIGDLDDDFFVLIDEEEVAFSETKTLDERTLTIDFPNGAELIEIIGTETTLSTAQVTILGDGAPGCEIGDNCFAPTILKIKKGITVTWLNPVGGLAAHAITSGTPGVPDGLFSSSLFVTGTTFSYQFNEAGEFEYFDPVHPWETGTIFVDG